MFINTFYNRSRHEFISVVTIICILFTTYVPIVNAQSHQNNNSPTPSPKSYLPTPLADDLTFVANNRSDVGMGCQTHGPNSASFEIAVDRYVGNVDRLLANVNSESGEKLISEMSILKLSVNDHTLNFNNSMPDPQQYQWYLNEQLVNPPSNMNGIWTLKVDTRNITFPSDPGPGGSLTPHKNVIRIDTGSTNVGTNLCTIINWAALNIEVVNPAILIHGILSDSNTWRQCDENTTRILETNWMENLDGIGIPVSAINLDRSILADQDSPSCKSGTASFLTRFKNAQALASIEDNANRIAIELESLRKRWRVEKFNLVTHSKGGIDARDYAEKHDTIDKLIQIGTPNGGSHLADALQTNWIRGAIKWSTGIDVSSPRVAALSQLTTASMEKYNSEHGWNRNIIYISLAGDYRYMDDDDYLIRPAARLFHSESFWRTPLNSNIGLHDGVVSAESAHSLNYVRRLWHKSSGDDTQALHWYMTRSPEIYNKLIGYLTERRTSDIQPLQPIPTSTQTTSTIEEDSNASVTQAISGVIYPGQTVTRTLIIDDNSSDIEIMLYHTEGDVEFSLLSPSGAFIDIDLAKQDQNYSYSIHDWIGTIQTYSIAQNVAEVGNWTIVLSGKSVGPAGVPFSVTALLNASAISANTTMNKRIYRKGETVLLTTTILDDHLPLTSASVTVDILYPDGVTGATLSLVDDGTSGDKRANDGVYSGLFKNTTQSGTYRADVTVIGAEQQPFSRSSTLYIPISISNSIIVGNFKDYGHNSDNDDYYNQLVIDTEIKVTDAAKYRIFAELADSNGKIIEQISVVEALDPGIRKVSLIFDGILLRQHGVDGPYQLKAIRLLLLDEKFDAYRTQDYRAEQFQPASISVFSDSSAGSGRGISQNHVEGTNEQDTHAVVIDDRDAARGDVLYPQMDVCNDFNEQIHLHTSNSNGPMRDYYGGWAPHIPEDDIYKGKYINFSRERAIGPGINAGRGYSAKISSSYPYSAGYNSPLFRVPPGSKVTVKVNYLLWHHGYHGPKSDWASMSVKPDATGNEALYAPNGLIRGSWAQLEKTIVAGSTGQIMILLRAQSEAAVNSNVYFDDIRIFVNGEPLESCVYEALDPQ